MIDEDAFLTSRKLADELSCSHEHAVHYLHDLENINIFGRWLPHKLAAANKKQCTDICLKHLS